MLGDAAQEEVGSAAAGVSGHDDEVGRQVASAVDDAMHRVSESNLELDFRELAAHAVGLDELFERWSGFPIELSVVLSNAVIVRPWIRREVGLAGTYVVYIEDVEQVDTGGTYLPLNCNRFIQGRTAGFGQVGRNQNRFPVRGFLLTSRRPW